MGARSVGGGEAFWAASAEGTAVKIPLGRAVRGGHEVEFLPSFLNPDQFRHIEGTACGGFEFSVFESGPVEVLPLVPFTPEQEAAAVAVPGEVVVGFDPGFVGVDEQWSDFARGGFGDEHAVGVLQAVQLLQQQATGAGDPLEVVDVMLARVARGFHPANVATRGVHHADAAGRVEFARLGVGNALNVRVQAVGVVHQGHFADALSVQLPEGNGLAVGAPAEAVLHGELLFVDPIECAVDEVFVGRVGEGGDLAGAQVLRVQVAFADVGHVGAVGRELGELQARVRGIATELEQLMAGAIEHQVIAAGVGSPHLLAVGVNEHLGAIGRPSVVIHRERLSFAGRN